MWPDGDGGESLNTFLSKKGHISTWMLILDADPAFACINMPLTFRVLNISPMYHGTEMVMSRSLQMMMLSPLKRWGEGITVKQKKHDRNTLYPSGQRLRVEITWYHGGGTRQHLHTATSLYRLEMFLERQALGSLLIDFCWWVGGQSRKHEAKTCCRCFQHILDYLLLINRLNAEEKALRQQEI